MENGEPFSTKFLTQIEINHTLTVLYTLVEVGRQQGSPNDEAQIRHAFGMVLMASLFKYANICVQRKPTVNCSNVSC